MSLGEELLMLKAASEGHLDDVPLADIHAFERAFTVHFAAEHPAVLSQIDRLSGDIGEFTVVFAEAMESFRTTWFREREL
jgi:F0F1-type ATP synthase alpha subunit